MKRILSGLSLFLFLFALLTPFNATANTTKTAEIYKGTPVIDGEMDEIWKTAKEYTVDKTPVIRDKSLDPDIDWNPRNVKGKFRLLWDEKHLYVYAHIDDPFVRGAEDRFKVFISPTNNKEVYKTSKPGQYDENAPHVYKDSDLFLSLERNKISAQGPDGKFTPKGCYDSVKDGIVQKRKTKVGSDESWIVEAKIPWASGVSIKEGNTIGFDCEIDDQDTRENGRGMAVWNQPNAEAWCNPSQTGNGILKGVGNVGKDPSKNTDKPKETTTSQVKPGGSDKDPDKTNKNDNTKPNKPGIVDPDNNNVDDSKNNPEQTNKVDQTNTGLKTGVSGENNESGYQSDTYKSGDTTKLKTKDEKGIKTWMIVLIIFVVIAIGVVVLLVLKQKGKIGTKNTDDDKQF